MNFKNGKQISPCILSKVRYALGLKHKKPRNSTKCSYRYWVRTINRVIELSNPNIPSGIKQKAIDEYN